MDPTVWLNGNVPGFGELQPEEREAIANFALLWSLFEARCLPERGVADAIRPLVERWVVERRLDAALFAEPLAYFRYRYFENGIQTPRFDFLRVRRKDIDFVTSVLRGDNNDPADCVATVLMIVYRLRNNLFHGAKWAYALRDQQTNFEQANSVLMNAMAIAEHRMELVA